MSNDNSQKFLELVDEFENEYPENLYKNYPEFVVEKLQTGISKPLDLKQVEPSSLNYLPSVENRTKEDVVSWIKNHLDYDTMGYIGV